MCQQCPDYVELHLHTIFSQLDALNHPQVVVERACQYGYTALGVSEHRNLNSSVQMALAAKSAAVCNLCGKGTYPFDWDAHKKGMQQTCMHCRGTVSEPRKFKIVHALEVDEVKDHRITKKADLDAQDSFHFWMGALTPEGWNNLVRIQNESVRNGSFGNKNYISLEWIAEHNLGRGLAATSACLGSRLATLLIGGSDFNTGRQTSPPDYDRGKEFALWCRTVFDEFYLELQANEHKDQVLYNAELLRLHQETGIPLVITKDVHYTDADEGDAHDTYICTRGGSKPKADPTRRGYPGGFIYHLATKDEIWQFCQRYGIPAEAMENTARLADSCSFELKLGRNLMPVVPVPNGYTPETYLRKLAFDGLIKYLRKHRDIDMRTYIERLEMELSVICPKGFASYFIMLADIMAECRRRNIPTGPGRGSVCASLVAMVIGITKTDPIIGDLVFERFLNPERASLPDIDTDVSHDRRHEIAEYILNKYAHCMHIPNWTTLGVKSGLRALGRAFQLDKDEVDNLSDLVPDKMPDQSAITFRKLLEIPENPNNKYSTAFGSKYERIKEKCEKFKAAMEKYPNIAESLQKLEGSITSSSLHAAGIVVLPAAPDECGVPLTKASDGAVMPVCGWDMNDVEKAGLLKLDLLGLRTVTVMHRAWQLAGLGDGLLGSPINERNMDNPKVFKLLRDGDTVELFQVNGDAITEYLMRARPFDFGAIVSVLATFRPGPLDAVDPESKLTLAELYIRNRMEPDKISYMHPDLKPILERTAGVLIYQEQVMQVFRDIAGYSWGKADLIRRALGKKRIDELKAMRVEFIEAGTARGYGPEMLGLLFDQIEKFAGYCFNVAHSRGYAWNTYETAYLKVFHPTEFMAAALSSVDGDKDSIIELMRETKRLGLDILGPDINESEKDFTVVTLPNGNKAIRFGLLGISGVGAAACEKIAAVRPFADLPDFVTKLKGSGLNKNGIGALIKAGAFDSFGENRYSAWTQYHFEIRNFTPTGVDPATLNLTRKSEGEVDHYDPDLWDLFAKLAWEKETLGSYITGHPLQDLPFVRWSEAPSKDIELAGEVIRVKTHKAKTGEMAWLTIETQEDTREVTVFPRQYEGTNKAVFVKGAIVKVKGSKDPKDSEKLLADKVTIIRMMTQQEKDLKSTKKGKGKAAAKQEQPRVPTVMNFTVATGANPPAVQEVPPPSPVPKRANPLDGLFVNLQQ